MIRAPAMPLPRQRLPVAAMIDMVFLIVFYFLAVGSVGQETGVLQLQLASPIAQGGDARVMLIDIDAQGTMLLNGAPMDEAGLESIAAGESAILIRAHDAASHASVTRAVEAIARAGATPRLTL